MEKWEQCPFKDKCAAAGISCQKKDVIDYCNPVFKKRYQPDASFIKWRIFQHYFSEEEIAQIQNRTRIQYLLDAFPLIA